MTDPQNGYWLLPSRKRPHNLKRFCQALHDTKTSTPGLILIKSEEFDDPNLASAYSALSLPNGWQIVKTIGDSQGDKLREIEQQYSTKDWVGLIGDDQVVQTEQWDLKLIAWLKGWNLVSCYDDDWQINQRGGRIAGTMLFSMELVQAVGYIFPPRMHHVYLDDIWEELGSLSGCWSFADHVCPDVVIAHLHPDRGMSEKDETYSKAYDYSVGECFAGVDYLVWREWREAEMLHAAERAKSLRERLLHQQNTISDGQ